MTQRTAFLDAAFDTPPMGEVEQWLVSRTADSDFGYIVTPNVDHLIRLATADDEVRLAYRDADLCVCDSRILQRLGRVFGVRLSLVPGSDLVAALFGRLLQDGDRICLIGGSADHLQLLQQRYPRLVIQQYVPPMGLREDAPARRAVLDVAANAAARATLLAVGSPQQEILAHEMARSGRVRGTALCIGAAVDFLVGAQQRAPVMVQRAGFEWAWRLARQPRRLARRYLIDGPRIFPMALRWWWSARKGE
ncbi:WecB/TagA/CpsF family glycosyltransferase [soil metagenome]